MDGCVYGNQNNQFRARGLRKAAAGEALSAGVVYGGFTEVVLRASIPDGALSGRELLSRFDSGDSAFTMEELDTIDTLSANDAPPEIP